MEPNTVQIGGDHYKGDYQHWDMVCDTNLHYLLACATKYVVRYEHKNGVEDLRKAIHFISKAKDKGINPHMPMGPVVRLVSDLPDSSKTIIYNICLGQHYLAIGMLSQLISEIECGATPAYVDQG